MEGNYCEARAARKQTPIDMVIRVAVWAFTIACVLIGIAVNPLVIILAFGGGLLIYFYLPTRNVEYEYIFCDGQIDFDKIMSGERRKHVARIDMEQVVVCAPEKSNALLGYKRDGIKVYNFTSLTENARVWGIVANEGNKQSLYYFEPSEEMLRRMKQKGNRKIVEY